MVTIGKKLAKIVVAGIIMLALSAISAVASLEEMMLFDDGYNSYLAYQPKKAVESFQKFLVDFPNSSLKDAALFWLGKSLLVLDRYEDAKDVFLRLNREIPDSPFVPHSERELETLKLREQSKQTLREAEKMNLATELPSFIAKEAAISQSPSSDDREKFDSLLQEQRERNRELEEKVHSLERQLTDISARLQSLQMHMASGQIMSEMLQSQSHLIDATMHREPIKSAAEKTETPVVSRSMRETQQRNRNAYTLVLIAHQDTWISVKADDREPREKILKPGTRGTWTAKKGFTLKIGNAGGVRALFNGRDIGPLGKQGDVIILKLPSEPNASPVNTS